MQIRQFADFSSHDARGIDHFGFMYQGDLTAFCDELLAESVRFPVELKKGVGGSLLCYVAAPDCVSIELMQCGRDNSRIRVSSAPDYRRRRRDPAGIAIRFSAIAGPSGDAVVRPLGAVICGQYRMLAGERFLGHWSDIETPEAD